MSQKRQPVEICRPVPHAVTPLRHDFAGRCEIAEHLHPEHQLIYATRGIMTVWTDEGSWVVPPHRAVWIPARTPHRVTIHGPVSMRTLYLRERLLHSAPRCCVINVSPLLRELILHACTFPGLTPRTKSHARVIELLLDQLDVMEIAPLQLIYPSDVRGARVARALTENPGDAGPLHALCTSAGASKRTIERIFREETHMALGRWRQQLRLLHSLHRLAAGEKVSSVALDLGYGTPSAFIAMFRRTFGTTPRRYFTVAAPSGSQGET